MSDPVAEYAKLSELLENSAKTRGDVYQELMNKEENVLNTVNRV